MERKVITDSADCQCIVLMDMQGLSTRHIHKDFLNAFLEVDRRDENNNTS
jgi:hypothetical protein